MNFGTPDDWQTLREVFSREALDPDSREARDIERRIGALTSQNLHQMAMTLLRNRYAAHRDPDRAA